jgi:hypothetical protein
VGLAASTTKVEDNVDDGSPRGRCRQIQQHPPSKLEMTSMVGFLGGAAGGSDNVQH